MNIMNINNIILIVLLPPRPKYLRVTTVKSYPSKIVKN